MSKCIIRVNDPKGFARAFKMAAGCAGSHSKHGYNRICDAVLLSVSGFKVTLRATDLQGYLTLDMGMGNFGQLSLDGGDGEFFLPSDWKAPSEPFSLEAEPIDEGLKVTCKTETLETTIPQENAVADYPLFPIGNAGVKFTLPAATLAHELNSLAPMCANERGRYALNGLLWDFGTADVAAEATEPPFTLRLVATDGRRLAAHALPVTLERPVRYQAILWLEHAHKLATLLKVADDVEVAFSPEVVDTDDKGTERNVRPASDTMFFGTRCFTYAARLVEGQYPAWRSVLPKCDASVLLNRQAFIDGLQAVKKACSIESAAVKLTFNARHLLLEAKSAVNGYAKTTIPLCEVPPMMALGADPEYLIGALESLNGEWVVLNFRSSEYGMTLHDGAPNVRYNLVMPIDLISEPTLPAHPGSFVDADEKWNSKAGCWEMTTDEEKAKAKAERDEKMAAYNAAVLAYAAEAVEWRMSKRLNEVKAEDPEPQDIPSDASPEAAKILERLGIYTTKEQEPGEFTPRPEHEPAIGTQLAPHPTLTELEAQAHTAPKPKARAKAKVPSTGLRVVKVETPPAVREVIVRESDEHLETPQELGYTLNKNQWSFAW
ncbi:MAG: hypothetical protein DPW14_14340 [Planctomycetes bacterium]|nr:hypothetical protein [Planctomycetota bacterium]